MLFMKPYAFFSPAGSSNHQGKLSYVCVATCKYGSHVSESFMLIK